VPGAPLKAGEEIGQVLSPEQNSIVATYMRPLADIAGSTAERRIKARVAQEALDAARSYMRVGRAGRRGRLGSSPMHGCDY
jgi:HlyD family secretion protein